MPKKKVNPAEEPEQIAAMTAEQAGEEARAALGETPQDMGASGGSPLPELGEPGDAPGLTGDGEGDAPEVMAVDAATFPLPPDSGPEEAPPMEPPGIVPGDGQPLGAQELGPDGDVPTGGSCPAPPLLPRTGTMPRPRNRRTEMRPPRQP